MSNSKWAVLARPFRVYTIIGAGLWWTVALVQFMPVQQAVNSADQRADSLLIQTFMFWILWAFSAVLLCLMRQPFSSQKGRYWLVCLVTILSIASISLSLCVYLGIAINEELLMLGTFMFHLSYTILLFLWGVRFALLDIEDASPTVFSTAIAAFVLLFCIFILPPEILFFIKRFLILISALLFIQENKKANSWYGKKKERSVNTLRYSFIGLSEVKISFFISRLLIGLGLSACSFYLWFYSAKLIFLSMIGNTIAVALLVVAFLFSLRKREKIMAAIPLLPILIVIVVGIVFLPSGIIALCLSSASIAWFSWIVLSSTQLSEIRKKSRVDIILLTCVEKTLIILPLSFAGLIGRILPVSSFSNETIMSTYLQMIAIIITFCIVATAVHVLLGITIKDGKLLIDQERSAFLAYDKACLAVAERYALTSREQEVMAYLGKGYTRTAISNKLVIADGTTRTHIRSIHKKMIIQKNDQLIDALYNEMEKLS